MRQSSFAEMHCHLARSLDVMGDWWSPLILRDLYVGVRRFDELVTDLGISRNLLTTRLARLVAGGVVRRERYQSNPPRFEYHLTDAGRELVPILVALTSWGDRWQASEEGAPVLFRHRGCGEPLAPIVSCGGCGERVGADDIELVPGPGGRIAPGTEVVARRIIAGEGPTIDGSP